MDSEPTAKDISDMARENILYRLFPGEILFGLRSLLSGHPEGCLINSSCNR